MRALIFAGEMVAFTDAPPQDGDLTVPHPSKPHVVPLVVDRPEYDLLREALDGPVYEVSEAADVVTERWTVRPLSEAEVAARIAGKIGLIDAEYERRWQLPIEHEVGGETYTWHADLNAVGNIQGVVLMIAAGVPVPNPRPWTPVGSMTAVNITHAELIGLGAAIAIRKDALFVLKKIAQATVAAMTDPADIEAFDPVSVFD